MNETVNKSLLAGNKFTPEMHLRQPTLLDKSGFICSACGPFTKNKEGIQKIKGCVHYIFASLFCMSKIEHFETRKNGFKFT